MTRKSLGHVGRSLPACPGGGFRITSGSDGAQLSCNLYGSLRSSGGQWQGNVVSMHISQLVGICTM